MHPHLEEFVHIRLPSREQLRDLVLARIRHPRTIIHRTLRAWEADTTPHIQNAAVGDGVRDDML